MSVCCLNGGQLATVRPVLGESLLAAWWLLVERNLKEPLQGAGRQLYGEAASSKAEQAPNLILIISSTNYFISNRPSPFYWLGGLL